MDSGQRLDGPPTDNGVSCKLCKWGLRETLGLAGEASVENVKQALQSLRQASAHILRADKDSALPLDQVVFDHLLSGHPISEEHNFVLRRLAEVPDGSRYLAALVLRAVSQKGDPSTWNTRTRSASSSG